MGREIKVLAAVIIYKGNFLHVIAASGSLRFSSSS